MRSFLLTLCLLLPAVVAAQDFGSRFPAGSITTREQASQALEEAEKEYARVQTEFDARDAQCYREILVNDCRSKVRRERELARREVRRVELEAKDTQRRLDHEDLMRRRAEQDKQQAAEAEARRAQEAKSRSAAEQRQQKADEASKGTLTPEEVERNRAEYERKQKEHAARLAKEQQEAAQRAQNAAEYQKKQEEAAERAEVNAAERKRREERRAERKKEPSSPAPALSRHAPSPSLAQAESSVAFGPVRKPPKVGRNEPCPCGSGKKYKKCCGS